MNNKKETIYSNIAYYYDHSLHSNNNPIITDIDYNGLRFNFTNKHKCK